MRMINVKVQTGKVHDWLKILHKGVGLKVRVGIGLVEMLVGELGLDPEFIDSTVKTIFLDGRPVDDVEAAKVKGGATLALAGAMPGLVGACMRVNSPFAGFRSSITYSGGDEGLQEADGEIELKLFNMVADAVGSDFMGRGVIVPARRVAEVLEDDETRAGVLLMTLDGRPVDGVELDGILEEGGTVFLQVS